MSGLCSGIDAPLSEEGKTQCVETRAAAAAKDIDFVLVSPLRRAMETAHLMFEGQGKRIIVMPNAYEMMAFHSEISVGLAELKAEYEVKGFEFDWF